MLMPFLVNDDTEINIDSFLLNFKNKEIFYLPNPGNAGDSIIAAATYQSFRRHNISFIVSNPKNIDPRGKIIFYGGGGNMIGMETYASQQIARLHEKAEMLVILPQTIKDVDHIIQSFNSNVVVICREYKSLDYVRSFDGKFYSFLAHDMAFSLDTKSLLSSPPNAIGAFAACVRAAIHARGRTKPSNMIRLLFGRPRGRLPERKTNGPILNCFRLDGERTNISIPDNNYDLSAILEFGVAPEQVGMETTRKLLCILDQFDEIRTNRLHIAISSAILGKIVKVYANNYYKVRAVYEYSMMNKFDNVEWKE